MPKPGRFVVSSDAINKLEDWGEIEMIGQL